MRNYRLNLEELYCAQLIKEQPVGPDRIVNCRTAARDSSLGRCEFALIQFAPTLAATNAALKQAAPTERLNALTSLRFFAAMMIVLLHFSSSLCPEAWQFVKYLTLGQGVAFFYVLSGFILTYVYPELAGLKNVLAFLRARFARIYPCHLVGLGLSLLLVPTVMPHSKFVKILLANLLLIQDWIPIRAYYFSLNAPAWSISCEFFFYLTFPFLIHRFARTWKQKLLACALLVVSLISLGCYLNLPMYGDDNFKVECHWFFATSPLVRIFEFCLGMTAALLFSRVRNVFKATKVTTLQMTVIEIVLMIAALLCLLAGDPMAILKSAHTNIEKAFLIWAVGSGGAPIYAAILITFALQMGRVSKLLCLPFFVLLGDISYAIYLLHCPIIGFITLHKAQLIDVPPILVYAAFWIATLSSSYLCFELIEKPLRGLIVGKGLTIMPRKLNTALAANLCCIFILVGLTCVALNARAFNWQLSRDKVIALVNQTQAGISGTKFGDSFELEACALQRQGKDYVLKLVWRSRALQPCKYYVAVHDMDANGKLLGYKDYPQDLGKRWVCPGQTWQDVVPITNSQWQQTKQIGIGIYIPEPFSMLPCDRGRRDYAGHRLLISANELQNKVEGGAAISDHALRPVVHPQQEM